MDKLTELAEILGELPIVKQLLREKNQLDALKPLPQDVEARVMQKLRLDWNFHSNAIEGNKLTYGETYTFLMYGLTAKGKPFKDHLDIKGHNEAINFLQSLVKDDRDLTESDIRALHKMILVEPYQIEGISAGGQRATKTVLLGEYKKLPNHVKTQTGEIHYYANPEDVPFKMAELVGWFNEIRQNENVTPSVLAAIFHHKFVEIHPFDDGNGRLSRILMNLILMQKGYPPAIIKLKERTDYYAALGLADKNEYKQIAEFVVESVLDSVNLYLKAIKGESIESADDLDKEIALFKMSLGKEVERKTTEHIMRLGKELVKPIIDKALSKLQTFNELFETNFSAVYINN
ncbi:MAG: Fic family protein, partial [Saprospiraceae bacterium]|nr:Fic family protein [Saprospiraceae bacterium]